ncbi:hypothetical protein C8J56DRAFT_896195 [Mycena floridula]|nr:hypothetical protein C8J56DRAFT_896195 [Mycena floridula]
MSNPDGFEVSKDVETKKKLRELSIGKQSGANFGMLPMPVSFYNNAKSSRRLFQRQDTAQRFDLRFLLVHAIITNLAAILLLAFALISFIVNLRYYYYAPQVPDALVSTISCDAALKKLKHLYIRIDPDHEAALAQEGEDLEKQLDTFLIAKTFMGVIQSYWQNGEVGIASYASIPTFLPHQSFSSCLTGVRGIQLHCSVENFHGTR